MTTRKRPQLGALFGATEEAPIGDRGTTRLRSVGGSASAADAAGEAGAAGAAGKADGAAATPRRATGRSTPRILLDADTPAAGAADQPLPWAPGGWLDPLVIAGQYFDFWQAVLDSSRRLTMGVTAAAIGRSVRDRD